LHNKEKVKPHRYKNKIEKSKLKIEETSHAAFDKAFFEHEVTKTQRHEFAIAVGKYHEVNIAKLLSPQANIAKLLSLPTKTL
jgi:hypothetical protein